MAKTLRGLVVDNFKSVNAFGLAMGWNRNKTSAIVNMKQEPRISELQAMAKVLGRTVEEIASFYT